MPLPIIGGFILSAAGSVIGKALWNLWENRDGAAAAAAKGDKGEAPFASVLKDQTQLYAQAPGVTATDLPAAVAPLPTATVNFASLTARGAKSPFPIGEIQSG